MIVVVGSINMDLVIRVDDYPKPGETVMGSDYQLNPGGKGANQAVAAQRMGADVRMIGCLGTDSYGDILLKNLENEGIDTGYVKRLDAPTGAAFISLDRSGQNAIIVSPGANAQLLADDVTPDCFSGAKLVLLQLEVPLSTVRRAATLAKGAGAVVVLNAAPAEALADEDLAFVDLLVVNESEAGVLGERTPETVEEALEIAARLHERVPAVAITLGAQGVVWQRDQTYGHQPACKIRVVDTTGAGDTFVGALGAGLVEGLPWSRALSLANAAGALATTKEGAQSSLPMKEEVASFRCVPREVEREAKLGNEKSERGVDPI